MPEPEPFTLATDDATGAPQLRAVTVVVNDARGQRRVPLPRGTLVVGQSADVDVVVHDARVSRRHVELALLDDGVRVKDLGSKNGTWIAGVRVESVVVGTGAVVTVGDTTLALVAADVPAALAPLSTWAGLVTRTPAMASLFALLERAARSDVTVLLEGETGTGKDVLARAIHAHSGRSAGPFVVFDGGAVQKELVGSALFGHKKGSFTGAHSDQRGLFEAAHGGTLFLDEIGELPLDVQPALLRALESRTVRRIGDSAARPVDVRVVAATNRRLKAAVEGGAFRADLYFRLAVVRAVVPPLRARTDDLPLLVEAILTSLQTTKRPPPPDVARLAAYAFPGNVRELKNLLVRQLATGDDALSLPDPRDLAHDDDDEAAPRDVAPRPAASVADAAWRAGKSDYEKQYVRELLEKCGWNVSLAAREAQVDRKQIQRWMKKHGVVRPGT